MRKAKLYEIAAVRTDSGNCPFKTWYSTIKDTRARAVIASRLARVAAGNLGDWKNVGGGVNELRVDYGPGYRVYFAFHDDVMVVLIVGGDKHSQPRDIKAAQKLWEDHKHDASTFSPDYLE